MPYANGGNRFRQSRWYAAPNIEPMTLEERKAMIARQTPTAAPPAARKRQPLQWLPSELDGPQVVSVGGATYHVPADAVVKLRPPLAWVKVNNVVHVLSKDGDLLLPARDHLKFAEKWSEI